jgi:hypothetical protein
MGTKVESSFLANLISRIGMSLFSLSLVQSMKKATFRIGVPCANIHLRGLHRIALVVCMLPFSAFSAFAADDLAPRFLHPPYTTKPRCYWYWMDGHISKTGITKDLEAMKRVGIGGAFIGIISGQSGIPANPKPKALTPEWWGFIEHAIREASRIGVQIGLFNAPGWSQTGGPWVTPQQAMRHVVQTETTVTGPRSFHGKLPATPAGFQSLTIQAFPAPKGESVKAIILSRNDHSIDLHMPEHSSARSLTLEPNEKMDAAAELLASTDGKNFRSIRKFRISRHNTMLGVGPVPLAPITISFPAVPDRHFRLVCSSAAAIGHINLSAAARVEGLAEKSLIKMCQEPLPPSDFYSWPIANEPDEPSTCIRPDSVINLSQKLRSDGTLEWQVPPGDWVILHSGLVPTGTKNSPAPEEATGYEVDKMNRAALKSHFDAFITPLLQKINPAARKSWTHVIADSYEAGPQNWSDGMAADFTNRYGYDPLPFLPVMGRRIVGSADQSDRFLWDLRRFVADRIASEYVGGLRELCHQAGLTLWLENYGHWGFPAEFLQYGGQSDEVGGEFWVDAALGGPEIRAAASAAHTYGKRVVWAEAFTGGPSFANSPRDLKNLGDWSFAEGVNQFVFHVYIHQPWEDKKPGVNAWFGTEFNRHNTWFEASQSWIDYLRRCSVMLQTGHHVADVAYFIGEDTPKMIGALTPELPQGYDYDFINAEVIEKFLTVKDDRFVLPDGMSYRLLVLPDSSTMRPALLEKITQLVAAGGAVLGSPPSRSPSNENFPHADEQVKALASKLWQDPKVMSGIDLTQAFARLDLSPDVVMPADLRWKHRQDGHTDLYFLSNPQATYRTETISFRVNDRTPELWWPETGKIQPITDYQLHQGRLHVPITFTPQGSVFVVFRHPRSADHVTTAPPTRALNILQASYGTMDGSAVIDVSARLAAAIHHGELHLPITNDALGIDPAPMKSKQLTVTFEHQGKSQTITRAENSQLTLPLAPELKGPWNITFPDRTLSLEQLISWSNHPMPDIKYFSGTAIYQKKFLLSALDAPIHLDLGTVHAIATVRVNGKNITTLWKAPYTTEITSALTLGTNTLEVLVTNPWHNRLVGDQQPGSRPTSFTTTSKITAQTPLQPSGLLGPVRLIKKD